MACLRAVKATGADVHLVHRAATSCAPYDDGTLAQGFTGHSWEQAPDETRLRKEIEAFAPHVLLVVSWDVGGYRRLSRAMSGRTLRLLCMDNAWLGTAKQVGGVMISRLAIKPAYDAVFLPGDRQATFARRLGYADDRILWGFYSCDHDAFAAVADPPRAGHQRAFVFVGRLAPEKGVPLLAEAYRRYCSMNGAPWSLVVCGTGPLEPTLAGVPGVDLRGFVQPAELPAIFAQAACLVLPSTFEPWGVVVHEAAAAGLAVICSSACGAASRLVLDGYNGAVVRAGDPQALARAMADISSAGQSAMETMSRRSGDLARQFTPQRWATYLLDRTARLRAELRLGGR